MSVFSDQWNSFVPPLIREGLAPREVVIQEDRRILESGPGEIALEKLRQHFKISKRLNAKDDLIATFVIVGTDEASRDLEVVESNFLGNRKSEELRKSVTTFLKAQNLDPHLKEAVWYRTLYREWPPYKTDLATAENLMLFLDPTATDEELQIISLRAKEKKIIKKLASELLEISPGRPPKNKNGDIYREIIRRISISTNKRWRSKNFGDTLSALNRTGTWSEFAKKHVTSKRSNFIERMKRRNNRIKHKHPLLKKKS